MINKCFEKDGVYYSASDAESNHVEGGFFVYSYDEVVSSMKGLSKKQKIELEEALEFSEFGNFEDKIHISFYTNKRPENFDKIREKLVLIRQNRAYPFIDKKINTAWNAMMIEALFIASELDAKYKEMAQHRMSSLLSLMYKKGVLYHQTIGSKKPSQKALLEDYAFLISALIIGYEKIMTNSICSWQKD